ncbi:MAG: DUF1552 domain-containing protein [Pirellulaceae bacterium]
MRLYSYNLSWKTPTSPITPEANPRHVFERMFGYGSDGNRDSTLDQRRSQQKSILDFVLDDAGKANRSLAREDRAKLEEYLTSLREVERRIAMTESRPAPEFGRGRCPGGYSRRLFRPCSVDV